MLRMMHQVRMRDVQILVGTYSDGSMSIVVCSGGLRIHDTRNSRTQQPARTHHHDSTLVLAIGADWHDVSPGLPGEEAEAPAQRAQGLWSQVQHHQQRSCAACWVLSCGRLVLVLQGIPNDLH